MGQFGPLDMSSALLQGITLVDSAMLKVGSQVGTRPSAAGSSSSSSSSAPAAAGAMVPAAAPVKLYAAQRQRERQRRERVCTDCVTVRELERAPPFLILESSREGKSTRGEI